MQNVTIDESASGWGKLIISDGSHKLKMESVLGRADSILYANFIGKKGYNIWNWNNTRTLCKSHQLAASGGTGGVRKHTLKATMDYLNTFGIKYTVILTTGFHDVLEVDPVLKGNKSIQVLNTKNALSKFNELSNSGEAVVGFFHMTC